MARPSISVAVIAKNERNNIDRWYKSIEGIFDDYIFVDTGSVDGTIERAQELKLNLHHFSWINDFSAARNYSFSLAKTDYTFWMDLDDTLVNPEAFKVFRDDIMKIADYWVAAYDYATDSKTGIATCSFARERVIKNGLGMKWKYFVHEGILPSQANRLINCQYIPSWRIKHHRTVEDLAKDKGRNLKLFEGQMHTLDARMKYYYGKELFEAQQPAEAIKWLVQASIEPTIETHDRILSIQYAAYAATQIGQYQQAISLGLVGLELSPNRAEFYNIIGDAYLKLGRPNDSKPFFYAACNCEISIPSHIAGPIFNHPAFYGEYPANQLARVYANTGRLDKALTEARGAFLQFGSEESRVLMEEIFKVKKLNSPNLNNPTPCDDIVFTCPPQNAYEFDADLYKTKAMGGSETALIEMAHHLHQLTGRKVKVFNMRKEDKICDGVEYISADKLLEYMSKNKPYFHIAWRHNIKVTNAPTFLWCHDLTTPGAENTANYDKILCLTPFHKRYVMQMQGITEDKIYVTRNGINPDKFVNSTIGEKRPFQFIFSSSPDRGLDRCMLVLDEVRKIFPEVKLHIAYGIEHLEKYGLKNLQDQLTKMFEERKEWVTYHGALEQSKLFDLMRESAYCVQPSDFIETSMISAVERLCCGVYAIMRRVGGCADTLAEAEKEGMATLVDSNCIDPHEYKLYIDATIQAIKEERYKNVRVDPTKYSWLGVANEWLELFPHLIDKKSA